MEYSSMRRSAQHQLTGIARSHTDDDNHSVFDFPLDPSDDGRLKDDDIDGNDHFVGKKYGKQRSKKKKKTASSEPPTTTASPPFAHPYPSSISIQMNGSPPTAKSSKHNEFRSPATSPGERNHRANKETRQPNSPNASPNSSGSNSELTKYHQAGLHHFHSNRLSEAVDAYSLAIRAGLEELTHRKEMVSRMMGHRGRNPAAEQDNLLLEIGQSLAETHMDMATTLEIAQKYAEAKVEYENGLGMLMHTCHVSKNDKRVKQLLKNMSRMDRALSVSEERRRQTLAMEGAFKKLSQATKVQQQDEARRGVTSSLKKLLRIERESLGEHSYAYAKLKLKLAKVKCEGGDIDGGLHDASSAVTTIKSVLGKNHTLVGAACLFVAAVYEKRASMMYDKSIKSTNILEEEGMMTPECKSMMNKALELYADALEPLKFKYDHLDSSGSNKHSTTSVQPDIGEVFYKIAKLYSKKGSHASAIDAYRRSLEAYGAAGMDRSDVSKKKKSASSYSDFHPDAAIVWHDLATLNLAIKEYSDAVYASEKAVELARQVLKSAYNEKLETLPVMAYQIAGDAYGGLCRYEDATRSYQEACYEFKKIARSGTSSKMHSTSLGPVMEARLLRKLGMSLFNQNKFEDAKTHLMDAFQSLRSVKEGEASVDLPNLLTDIGLVHIKCGESTEAMNALRLCLKMYADRGVSDHSSEVDRARQLFKEAQRGGSVVAARVAFSPSTVVFTGTPSTSSTVSDHSSPVERATQLFKEAQHGGAVVTASPPTTSNTTMMETPRSGATTVTFPSSRASTSRSGHGQLQTLFEELTEVGETKESSKVNFSPQRSHHHQHQGQSDVYEMQRLKSQLEDGEKMSQQYQLRINEIEAQRDQEKKDRITASVVHRKEMEALTQSNMEHAVMEAELESLRKEVNISETSYQELVKAIDDEKEKILRMHESTVRELENENEQLQDQLKNAGAVENNRLSEELATKRREIATFREQSQNSSQEVMALQSKNRTLQSEKEAATREVSSLKSKNGQLQNEMQRMSSELSAAKLHSANSVSNSNNSMELKKLEFELQSERSRRMILESSLQKEYDQGNSGNGGGGGGNGGGGYAYPMNPMMPFGYPPMQYGSSDNNNNNTNNAKFKTLEIDLATERAGKEMLDNVISELRSTHEQETYSMQSQYSAVVASHEREMSDLLSEVGTKRAEVDCANQALVTLKLAHTSLCRHMDDTTDELSDVKEQLMLMSCDLSTSMEEQRELSTTVSKLEKTKEDLVSKLETTKEDLHRTKAELKIEKESLRRKETEGGYLSQENGRLKKEYLEAITLFETEMNRAKTTKEEVRATLGNKVDRLQNELGTAKLHLKNVLSELEVAHQSIGALDTNSQHLKMEIDSVSKDLRTKEEQLHQAQQEIEDLTENYDELDANMSNLEGIVSVEKQARSDEEHALNEAQRKLSMAEKTIKEQNGTIGSLESEKSGIEARFESEKSDIEARFESEKSHIEARLSRMEEIKKKLEEVLVSIPQKLEDALPDLDLTDSSTGSRPSDEKRSDPTRPESLAPRISSLLKQITDHIKHLDSVIESRDKSLDKSQWNLSNTAHDLDQLESKHKTLKEALAEMGDLQGDYDELLEQYELVVEEKEALDERIKTDHLEEEAKENESLRKAQEERDLFESRLKEAVDDLEELECERDEIRVELDRAQAEFAKKEGSFGNRIRALETDNKLIETLESQALEYDAALGEKDAKLTKVEEELHAARSEVDEVQDAITEINAALLEKDEELKSAREQLQMTRDERDRLQSESSTQIEDSAMERTPPPIGENDCDIYPDILFSEVWGSDNVQRGSAEIDAALREKDEELKSAKQELQMARAELDELQRESPTQIEESTVKKTPIDENNCDIYPDILFSDVWGSDNDIYPDIPFLEDNATDESTSLRSTFCARRASNPFDGDLSEDEGDDFQDASCDHAVDYQREAVELKARIIELESFNNELTQDIERMKLEQGARDEIAMSREKTAIADSDEIEMEREREAMTEEIESLKNQAQALEESYEALSTQFAESRDEMTVAATIHENDIDAMSSLQKTLNEKNELHREEVADWKNQVEELQMCNDALKEELSNTQILAPVNDDFIRDACAASPQHPVPQASTAIEDVALLEDIATLEHQVHTLDEQNAQLSAQLAEASRQIIQGEQGASAKQITSFEDHVQALEDYNEELSAQLAQSEAKEIEATMMHEDDKETINSLQYSLDQKDIILQGKLSDQDKLHQADLDSWKSRVTEAKQAHENDETIVISLQNALNEKENVLQDQLEQALSDQGKLHQADLDSWKSRATEAEQSRGNDQATIMSLQNTMNEKESLLQALSDQDKLHQSDLGTWKSKVVELKQSNEALNRELRELSVQTTVPEDHTECNEHLSSIQVDLQNALNDREEEEIQHNLQLATVNAEFHNAMNSLDELQNENQKLKGDIESLSSMQSSKGTDENRNFEKEMNAAHTRFVSMEKALEERASRLEREKDKLIADFNAEMVNNEEAHIKTKIELSAWKLEMQNALNDIESLKKERDDLNDQVQCYIASLEAMCMRKAKLEEKMHSLGISG